MIYRFDDCALDTASFELRRDGTPNPVEPQVFDLLLYLIEHRDRVVTRDELFEAVWPGRIVSESALSSRVKAARQAIGDNGRDQHFIRTVHGRGFQFIRPVNGAPKTPSVAAPAPYVPIHHDLEKPVIGREAELETLAAAAEAAGHGDGRLIFVAGEAGIGKTTLIRCFLNSHMKICMPRIAVGQCIEQSDSVEPFLALLDALGQLCRQDPDIVDRIRRHAPTWLLQLPSLLDDDALADLQKRLAGSTRDRMPRELAEFLRDQASHEPLTLVFEDLHWADSSTLTFLNFIARRGLPRNLLVIGTYRTAMAVESGRTVDDTVQELTARQMCALLDLGPLGRKNVSDFLDGRLDNESAPPDMAESLYTISNGNPLFMEALADWWISQNLVSEIPGPTAYLPSHGGLGEHIPPLLLKVMGVEFERLGEENQRVLEWAGGAGAAFSIAILAMASGTEPEEVEDRLLHLARRKVFVDQISDHGLSLVASDFAFHHALYREAIYAGVPATRRRRMHASYARSLCTALHDRAEERAAELAYHFVGGGVASEAVKWLYAAARQAARRGGHSEALNSLRRALAIIDDAREASLRDEWQPLIEAAIAPNVVATSGIAAPESEASYLQALASVERAGNVELLSSLLYELATLHELRGEFDKTQELLRKRMSLGGTENDSDVVETAELMACSAFHQGRLQSAIQEADRGLSRYDPDQHVALTATSGRNPAVSCEAWAARALCFMGFPDLALRRIEHGLAVAERDAPFTLANAHEQAAYLRQHRLEDERVSHHAEQSIELARAQNLPYRLATGTILKGWALSTTNRNADHLDEMEAALAECAALGMRLEMPYLLGLLADARLAADDPERALKDVNQALGDPSGQRGYYYQAELHRLRGRAIYLTDGTDRSAKAKTAFEKAISVAQEQSARLLALRAATSMVTLLGATDVIERTLRPLYDSFTEGFDTPDLKEAKTILDGAR